MVLHPGKKYEMRQEGCIHNLCIQNLVSEDSGYYTCDAGDQLTTAALAVQGNPTLTWSLVRAKLVNIFSRIVRFWCGQGCVFENPVFYVILLILRYKADSDLDAQSFQMCIFTQQ